ncbi:MAG TPA: TetR/AcrR family transcriptional regulator [Solirubrobacteraceae bacterium]
MRLSTGSQPLRAGWELLSARLPPGPRGREGPDPEQVATHQRTRLELAMIEAVGEHGYEATKITELASRSGVSTRSFYDLFSGKDECLFATYEMVVGNLTRRIIHAQARQHDWRDGVYHAFEVLTQQLAQEPGAARLALIDVLSAGPESLVRMRRTVASLEQLIFAICARAPTPLKPPRLLVRGVIAGLTRVVRAHILEGRIADLPDIAEELAEWTLSYASPAAQVLESPDLAHAPSPQWQRSPTRGRCSDPSANPHGRPCRDERARVLEAALKIAAEEGAAGLTVGKLAFAGGVSKRRVRELFGSCVDCLLRAFELACARALGEGMEAAESTHGDWPGAVRRTAEVFVASLVSDPTLARVACVEVLAVGPAGLECRDSLLGGFEQALLRTTPTGLKTTPTTAAASVGAAWGIVCEHACQRTTAHPSVLAASVAYMLLAPVMGASRARSAIEDGHTTDAGRRYARGATE